MQSPPTREDYERRFRRAGLPLFITGRRADRDIFNRAAPFLGLVFFVEVLGAINLSWSVAANAAVLVGALLVLLAALVLLNRWRGRPALAMPAEVGWIELLVFVAVPALLPFLSDGSQWRSALVTAFGNLVLVGLVWAVVGFGLFSIIRWALTRMLGQLRASLELFARAIPLLMIFSVVLFLTNEMWQVFGQLDNESLALLTGLFVLLGGTFLIARLPREVSAIEEQAGADDAPPLRTGERINVGLVMFVSQALQVLFVSLAIGGFFVALGIVVIDQETVDTWLGLGASEVLWESDFLGHTAVITSQLLRVAGAIAAFTGLYFAISMLTDDVYRKEFLEELTGEMRQSFRDRAEYRRLPAKGSES